MAKLQKCPGKFKNKYIYICIAYIKQSNSNNKRIGTLLLHNLYLLKVMPMFNALVIKNDPVKEKSSCLCFY